MRNIPEGITGHFRNRFIGGTDSIYKAYLLGLCKGISPQNMAKNMVQYLHFRILEFPLMECPSSSILAGEKSWIAKGYTKGYTPPKTGRLQNQRCQKAQDLQTPAAELRDPDALDGL